MKWQFEEVEDKQELEIVLKKAVFDREVEEVISWLERIHRTPKSYLPVRTADRIQVLQLSDLILVEVDGRDLHLYTSKERLVTQDRLYKFKEMLGHEDFVQISKQALINIRHLDYLEASFSGNMTAFLTKGLKTTVSRRYLKDLEARLGLR